MYSKENIADIQIFAVHHNTSLPIQIQLEQVTEDVIIRPDLSKGLEKAIEYIKNVSLTSQHLPSCSESIGCLENTREVLVRLKMLEWGLFGLGQATAGLFLAQHYSKLGPYFGDLKGRVLSALELKASYSTERLTMNTNTKESSSK